jgi:hypothetical protein
MSPISARRTTPSDAERLRHFVCSTGPWYEEEVQSLIRGLLADEVERGFSAWLVEDDALELGAIGAHVGLPHPTEDGVTITYGEEL